MTKSNILQNSNNQSFLIKVALSTVFFVLLSTFNVFSNTPRLPAQKGVPQQFNEESVTDSILMRSILLSGTEDSVYTMIDSIMSINKDTTIQSVSSQDNSVLEEWIEREVEFNPDPQKAVWLSALFPGLGQIYNRRYWKLPIIVGGYLGLAYATTWNNGMLRDYTNAYRDIMDSDPSTNSYMDFFPNTTQESSLDKKWLTNALKSRKDYYRRNRDLCIICMVGVYLVAMVDAYVDASLSHFDITPDLSVDVAPAVFQDSHNRYPSMGLQWAINF